MEEQARTERLLREELDRSDRLLREARAVNEVNKFQEVELLSRKKRDAIELDNLQKREDFEREDRRAEWKFRTLSSIQNHEFNMLSVQKSISLTGSIQEKLDELEKDVDETKGEFGECVER